MSQAVRSIVFGFAVIAACLVHSQRSCAAEPTIANIQFASIDGTPLLLDIYQPSGGTKPAPLIIWVHGGAWRTGTRTNVPITSLLNHGFAIASVDYRLSPVAKFPAQVHDIKAAIRFLRANADKYQMDPDRFVVAGASAGGHLAALVGVSEKVSKLEGDVGEHDDVPSGVSAIVSFYGASNLQTILSQSTPHGLSVRVPALELLLGGQPDKTPELAKLASPVTHVDARVPPLLLMHGDQDPQMPISQSGELEQRYQQVNRPVEFHIVPGAAHGGSKFYDEAATARVVTFLQKVLK